MTDCPDLPDWLPDPPMVFSDCWEDWRDLALYWIEDQTQPWCADDMRAELPTARPHWYGAAVRTATARELIRLVGQRRSTHPSRKGSLLAVWETI